MYVYYEYAISAAKHVLKVRHLPILTNSKLTKWSVKGQKPQAVAMESLMCRLNKSDVPVRKRLAFVLFSFFVSFSVLENWLAF